MPRKKKEEVAPVVENAAEVTEVAAAEAAPAEAPAEKPKRGRRKKAETAEGAAAEKKTTRKCMRTGSCFT